MQVGRIEFKLQIQCLTSFALAGEVKVIAVAQDMCKNEIICHSGFVFDKIRKTSAKAASKIMRFRTPHS
jgi:hypothetical protein